MNDSWVASVLFFFNDAAFAFEFGDEFGLGGEDGAVFGGEELFAAFEDGVLDDGFVLNQTVMGPAQFATQCVANLPIGIGEVELAEVPEVGIGEAFSEFSREGAGKFRKQSVAIGCFRSTALFFLHDPTADLPIGGDHGGIDGGVGGTAGVGEDAAHVGEKIGGWGEFVRHDSGGEVENLFEVVHGGEVVGEFALADGLSKNAFEQVEDLFLDPVGEDACPEIGFGGAVDDHLGRGCGYAPSDD